MTDKPLQFPAGNLERWAAFMGHVARPFSIIITSIAAAIAIVIGAQRVGDGIEGAAYIGAVLAGLVGLYGFKTWERRKEAEKEAEVAVAQSGATP